MLSSSLSISEFMEKVEGHSYHEIIEMTDMEATAVERLYYKSCGNTDCGKILCYAGCLKDFILYLRYGVKTRATRNLNLAPFREISLEH